MSVDQVKQLAYQMRLYGIQAHLERRVAEAVSQSLHPLELLRLLLEDEILARKDRVAKMLASRGRFRSVAELEDWDSTFDRGLTKQRFKELACLSFYHNQENLILLGKTGEGKTHLAVALGRKLCAEGIRTTFLSVNMFFEELAAARASGGYLKLIKQMTNSKVLILDDFALRSYTHEEATALVDLLEDRYRRGVVIVTSQVDPRGWSKLFDDPVIAEAIIDRLSHPSQRLALKGGSYRERLSARKPSSD